MNIWGYRPYWGESFPWNQLPEAKPEMIEPPLIKTVYYLPNSVSGERRYVEAYNQRPEYNSPYYSIVGGVTAIWPINKQAYLRASASYTQGLGYIFETFEVKTMQRDDFGVLVFSSPEKGFESDTRLSNIALDLTLLVYLEKR
ncbi:MAG: hypothetical protein K9J37_20205 [Saprospiraceae bacterium]|nr:hypothetical protein [Saprospiraceae bacterium]MCF8252251.1 hypothetical protein [Saprospiraceae bacterium]MCF8282342.1 hypothetical protein [Bacteroidales bacterium]MCF8313869.1 hypothetical protein [Saprospiraceae bacterium]MCF8442888.1 hypothetical protein [Saprospiraceae bacterium]